ncbi:unnamed protein product [Meloidogyne enterolobii]|uniref:Uncharacterized protein n=1 Tax=Meloidogyne enterolobii TaxID=390850 RepID=A0ACB0YBV4_MELEN
MRETIHFLSKNEHNTKIIFTSDPLFIFFSFLIIIFFFFVFFSFLIVSLDFFAKSSECHRPSMGHQFLQEWVDGGNFLGKGEYVMSTAQKQKTKQSICNPIS